MYRKRPHDPLVKEKGKENICLSTLQILQNRLFHSSTYDSFHILILNSWHFSFVGHFARGDGNKFVDLSYAELMQCVGVENFLHSWDDALDTFPLAAHCGLPDPPAKESDKVW